MISLKLQKIHTICENILSVPNGDSPLNGQEVSTEGIVTAAFYSGYFIQELAGGAWSGVWVHAAANVPHVGDRVRLTGTVDEYYGLTELDSVTAFEVLSTGNTVPSPRVLATGDVSQCQGHAYGERWEGVLVRVETVTVTDHDLGFGEWQVSDGR